MNLKAAMFATLELLIVFASGWGALFLCITFPDVVGWTALVGVIVGAIGTLWFGRYEANKRELER